jgi:hypothetical protein
MREKQAQNPYNPSLPVKAETYTPNFNKMIDVDTERKLKRLSRVARINAHKRKSGKQKPELKMLPLLIENFDSTCFWCECPVIRHIGANEPNNMATIDHMISRYFRKKGDEVLKVLACRRCNLKREKIDCKKILSYPHISHDRREKEYYTTYMTDLEKLQYFFSQNQRFPSYDELKAIFEVKSKNTTFYRINKLVKSGELKKEGQHILFTKVDISY